MAANTVETYYRLLLRDHLTNMAEIWYIGSSCMALTKWYKLFHPDLYFIFSDFFNYANFFPNFVLNLMLVNLIEIWYVDTRAPFLADFKKIGRCDLFNENGSHDS